MYDTLKFEAQDTQDLPSHNFFGKDMVERFEMKKDVKN